MAYEFGPFRLEPRRGLLLREGEPLRLGGRAFEALTLLVERAGDLVTKEELVERLWPDVAVEENNLNQQISALRRLLTVDGLAQPAIVTVPRRGFRFAAAVRAVPLPARVAEVPTVPSVPPLDSAPLARERRAPRWRWPLALGTVTGILAVAALVVGAVRQRPPASDPGAASAAGPTRAIASVAVLPFRPLSGDARDDYLGVGLADAVITRLGYLHALEVRPTSAVLAVGGGAAQAEAAGKLLHVDAVLEGHYQRLGERTRLTVQLIDASRGAMLWSAQLDVAGQELFTLEDRLATDLADQLVVRMTAAERTRLGARRPMSAAAYEAYLRGRYLWNRRNRADLERALAELERAATLAPDSAQIQAALADAHDLLGEPDLGRAAGHRALELDPECGEAYAALAATALFHDWDWEAAEAGFRRAIALRPSYASAHQWYAFLHASEGRFDEALAEIQRAGEIDPLSLIIQTDHAQILFFARRYDEAAARVEGVLRLDPSFAQAHVVLAAIRLAQGRPAVAEAVQSNDRALLAEAEARSGARDSAAARVRTLRETEENLYYWARAEVALGDTARTLELLQHAVARREPELVLLGVDPVWDPLRRDPAFANLVAGINAPRLRAAAVAAAERVPPPLVASRPAAGRR